MEADFGVLALLPPVIAIVLAMITKQVLISLFVGIWIGATMAAGWNPIVGLKDSFGIHIFEALGDTWQASVIIMTMLVGAFSAMIERGGGAYAFARSLRDKITNRKQGQLITWLGGVVIFFSDSTNPVVVGPVFRPITDTLKISREKLAYIVDSTSATLPALLPFTAWGAFIIGLIATEFEGADYPVEPLIGFVRSMPFMFYVIGAILLVLIMILINKDFGPMKNAEKRAYQEGKVLGDNAQPIRAEVSIDVPEGARPTIWNMVAPLIILVVLIFTMFLWTGGFPELGVLEAMGNANSMVSLVIAFFVASILAGYFAVRARVFDFKGAMNTWVGGIRQMLDAILILILAWAIGSAAAAVGTADYIVSVTEHFLTPTMMYVAIFVAASITAFSTGTSWGTFAIFMPIAIPLGIAIGAPVYPAIAAVVSGGIFGDHCSPISDTTVLSSMGSTSDHIDHVNTQLPYALTAAVAAVIGFVGAGITGSAAVGLIASLVALVVLALLLTSFFGEKAEEKKTQ